MLGVSSGIGSNPLKLKTLLQGMESENIRLFLVTEEEHFESDYKSYTESRYIEITTASNFPNVFPEEKFDYIIVEIGISFSDLNAFKKRLQATGKLLVWNENSKEISLVQKSEPQMTIPSGNGLWHVYG